MIVIQCNVSRRERSTKLQSRFRYACSWLGKVLTVAMTTACCTAVYARQLWQSDSVREGPDGVLCKEIQKRLNHMDDRCIADAIETYPQFSELQWQALDPNEHVELITKLMKYWQEGPNGYSRGQAIQPDSAYQYRAKLFLEHGGELHMLRTRLISYFHAGTEKTPPGEQTVLRLTDKIGAADPHDDCPGKASHNWVRGTFLVLPDLSGPDPNVDQGTAYMLHTAWPVLYQGRPLLINAYSISRPDYGICYFKPIE